MASIVMMLGGAVANALAFSGSSFLFSNLSKNRIDAEKKKHDLAEEKLQKAQTKWQKDRQERIDFINRKFLLEKKSEEKFTELNSAMKIYHEIFG